MRLSMVSSSLYVECVLAWKRLTVFPGRIKNADRMISTKIGLDEAEEKGFKAILGRKAGILKVLVSPTLMQT